MDWGLRLHRAFTLQVEIGAPRTDGINFIFPILAGSLETEPAFTPPLKVNSISGFDEALLVGNKLRLNVSVDLQLQDEPGAESERKTKLRWYGTVVIGEREQMIMGGNFQGETDFGNPLATFQFDASDEDLIELGDRTFVGQGRFVKKERSGNLNLIYQVSELRASELQASEIPIS